MLQASCMLQARLRHAAGTSVREACRGDAVGVPAAKGQIKENRCPRRTPVIFRRGLELDQTALGKDFVHHGFQFGLDHIGERETEDVVFSTV